MGLLRIYRSAEIGRITNWTSLGQLVLAVAGFCGGGALLSWVATAIEPVMRHGWGAAVFAGIGATCTIVIALSIGAFAIRVWFPAKRHPVGQHPEEARLTPKDDTAKELSKLETLIESIQYVYGQKLTELDHRFGSFSASIGKLNERMDAVFKTMEASPAPTGLLALGQKLRPEQNRFESLENAIEAARSGMNVELSAVRAEIDTLSLELKGFFKKHDGFVDYVLRKLLARGVEYDLDKCFEHLKPLTLQLFQPSLHPKNAVDWGKWDDVYREWQSRVRAICVQAKPYKDVEHEVFTINPADYRPSNWSFDQNIFPNEDQIMEYKDFCLRKRSIELAEPRIRDAVLSASRG